MIYQRRSNQYSDSIWEKNLNIRRVIYICNMKNSTPTTQRWIEYRREVTTGAAAASPGTRPVIHNPKARLALMLGQPELGTKKCCRLVALSTTATWKLLPGGTKYSQAQVGCIQYQPSKISSEVSKKQTWAHFEEDNWNTEIQLISV